MQTEHPRSGYDNVEFDLDGQPYQLAHLLVIQTRLGALFRWRGLLDNAPLLGVHDAWMM